MISIGKETINDVNSKTRINKNNIKSKQTYKCINKISNKILNEKIIIIHWNCNSLNNKIDEFKEFCIRKKPHIISLNETKLSDDRADYILQIDNYKVIHKSRSPVKNGAGGVALLVRDDIKFSECKVFEELQLEICAINIKLNNKEVSVISYYNPPHKELSVKIFDILKAAKIKFILLGDLNAKTTLWKAENNNLNGEILNEIILNYDCLVVNNKEPTHYCFNGNVESIIDFCIISSSIHELFESFEILENEDMTSDHTPCLIKFSCSRNEKTIRSNTNDQRNIYNLNKADWSKFIDNLPKSLPNHLSTNVDEINKFVVESIMHSANKAIPIYNKNNIGQRRLPKYVLELIKLRKKTKNLLKRDNDQNIKTRYNKLTRLIREEINALKNNEWNEFIQKLGKNPPSTKPFWKRINNIRGKKRNSSIPTLVVNNEKYETDEQKANLFLSSLKDTFSSNNNPIFNNEFKEEVVRLIANKDFTKHEYNKKDLFDLKDLNYEIKKLNIRSSNGEDKVHNKMLHNTSQEFRKIILFLINQTVQQSKIPQEWKNSVINMIPKKQNNSSDPKQYRPISLTSCIAKLAERLMLKKMKEFMENNNIISKQQSGFRKQRQTRDNLFHLTQKASESINRGKKMVSIFFDIASAFDKVWHHGLIYKLIKLNFPFYVICWLKEFLSNRKFSVRVNNFLTIQELIETGVPQGAVVSPTLFSIFINDIPLNYSKNKFYSLLFADDLCAFKMYKKSGKNINNSIQKYLNSIEGWLRNWRLLMAPSKCSYIVFSADKKYNFEKEINIKLFGVQISPSDSPVFLGIRFDRHLTFKNQISYMKESCLKRLNVLKVLSNKHWGLTTKTLTDVYNSLIRSLFEYSSIVYPCFSATNIEMLEKMQFKCLKIINKKSKFESNKVIMDIPGYLSLVNRFDNLNISYIKKSLFNKNPIIEDLYQEYLRFSESRKLLSQTLFCKYKTLI